MISRLIKKLFVLIMMSFVSFVIEAQNHATQNSLSFGFQGSSLAGTDYQQNMIDLHLRYGFVKQSFEYGPVLNLRMNDIGAGFDTDALGGGFLDYAFFQKTQNTPFISGITSQIKIGNFHSTGENSTTQLTHYQAGAFFTYFLFNSQTALRSELNYQMQNIKSEKNQLSVRGFNWQILYAFYF